MTAWFRFFVVFIVIIAHLPANAWLTGKEENVLRRQLEECGKRCAQFRLDMDRLEEENRKLRLEVGELRLKVGDCKEGEGPFCGLMPWMWGMLSILVAVCGFFLGRISHHPSNGCSTFSHHTGSGLPKCPRCGQEHDPSDVICKNPNCRTQF